MGPLFFILYVNDLLRDMQSDTIVSYADDTVIIASDNTWSSAQEKMNKYLSKVAKWLTINKLSLNLSKTVYITYGSYRDSVPETLDIKIGNSTIKREESYKYLGLLFDCNMKWDRHVNYIIKKTRYLIFIFAKIKNRMDSKTLMMIYYAFFQSIVNYGIIAWGGAYNNHLNLIQGIQNKLLKIINKNQFQIQYTPLTVRQLFQLEAVMYHYPNLRNSYNKSTSNTRNKTIQLPKIGKTVSKKNSYFVAINVFNSLTNDLKTLSTTKVTIKKRLKNFIRENYV